MFLSVIRAGAVASLATKPELAAQLEPTAEDILGRARAGAPSWLVADWFTWSGNRQSDGEAYAQALARGSGAVQAEYGGTHGPAYAMFRRAVR